MSNTLLIIEPNMDGHHARYVSRIARHAVAEGINVIVATSERGNRHEEIVELSNEIERFSDLPSAEPLQSFARQQFAAFRAFRAFARRVPANRILVPYADTIDKAAALLGLGSGSWDLLLMRSFFHHQAMGVVGASGGRSNAIKERLFRLLLGRRGVSRVLTIDELLPRYVRERGWPHAEKVVFVPDPPHIAPATDRVDARRRLSIAEGAPTVLVYGAISLRKGLADLLAGVGVDPEGVWRLLLVGLQDGPAKELLATPEAEALRRDGRLIELDRYVHEADEADAFAAADVVWLGYLDFQGSSGVLVQAAQTDRPVVGCVEGLIGWRTREYGLGAILQGREPQYVLDALREAFEEGRSAEAVERRRAFARDNSEVAFLQGVLGPMADGSRNFR